MPPMGKNSPTVSAVVVTFNRPTELARCLASLVGQSRPPDEVVVVDNSIGSGAAETEAICDQAWQMPVRYVLNAVNSLTVGRNLGVDLSAGDYVLLVDDDVTLDADYVATMLNVFASDETVVGAQGHISQESRSRARQAFNRIFHLYQVRPQDCRVMRSISTTYPGSPQGHVNCEWISGSNQFYRASVLRQLRWDENMIMYSDGEDLDHSFRVYRAYPGGLRLLPETRVHHDASDAGRLPESSFIVMREAYGLYLNYKLFPGSPAARAVFVWSRLGLLAIALANGPRRRSLTEYRALLRGLSFTFTHRAELRKGDLRSTNREVTSLRQSVNVATPTDDRMPGGRPKV